MSAGWYVSPPVIINTTRLRQVHRHGGGEIGDCYRTVIGCLIGATDPTDVPHFVADTINAGLDEHGGWEDITAARRWLRSEHHLDLMAVERARADELGVPYQLTVKSHAGDWNHSVLAQYGMVHWCPTGGSYTIEDAADEVVLVIVEPYDPDPDAMLADWRERFASVVTT